jgi:hypothetical protein
MTCVLLEKPQIIPACLPFGSVHFRQVHQDADRVLFVLGNEELKLRLECFEFLVQ